MYSSSYYTTHSSIDNINNLANASVWIIVSLILAIIGGILIYFLFLNKKNDGKFNGFVGWLYDFLSFKKMFMEALLKIAYIVVALFITLSSFATIGSNFLGFLLTLIVGNIIARLIYEFALILLVICRNTTEINKKLTKQNNDKDSE